MLFERDYCSVTVAHTMCLYGALFGNNLRKELARTRYINCINFEVAGLIVNDDYYTDCHFQIITINNN
jgi:hypothetical protein